MNGVGDDGESEVWKTIELRLRYWGFHQMKEMCVCFYDGKRIKWKMIALKYTNELRLEKKHFYYQKDKQFVLSITKKVNLR